MKWTKTKSPFIISLLTAPAPTGGLEQFGFQGINFSSERVLGRLWTCLSYPFPNTNSLRQMGLGFLENSREEVLGCVTAAVFQGYFWSGPRLCLPWRFGFGVGSHRGIELQVHDCLNVKKAITDFKSNQNREPILNYHFEGFFPPWNNF